MDPGGRDEQTHPPEDLSTKAPPGLTVPSLRAEETQQVGSELGRLLRPGDLLLLQGELGAGKTTFVQGVARGMGLTRPVTSPSFTLANVYEPTGPGSPLYHLDLWRIKSPLEALGIGLDEYLAAPGPCAIEWPEVAADVLPGEYLRIRFERSGDARRIELFPVGARPSELLDQLRAHLAAPGGGDASRH